MSKYLEFIEVPFKGKTKRFEVISKTSIGTCQACYGKGWQIQDKNQAVFDCPKCGGTGKTDIILGRISWYFQWRQYTFSPSFDTIWNKDCLNDIIFFINNLMQDRKIKMMKDKIKGVPTGRFQSKVPNLSNKPRENKIK